MRQPRLPLGQERFIVVPDLPLTLIMGTDRLQTLLEVGGIAHDDNSFVSAPGSSKKTLGGTWKNADSFSMCFTVSLRFPLNTSDTMDCVPKTGTRSPCFRPFSSISERSARSEEHTSELQSR